MTLDFVLASASAAVSTVQSGAVNAASRLGGGQPLDVSLGRIMAALVVCILVAVLAILLLRQRGGRIDLRGLFSRFELRTRLIEVVETRRLSAHGDICVVRHAGRQYLLVILAGEAKLLSDEVIADSLPEGGGR